MATEPDLRTDRPHPARIYDFHLGGAAYHQGDLRRPAEILSSPALRETLDLSQPVALSLNAVMHFVLDDEGPHEILRTLLDALPSGSFLEMSHGTADLLPDHVLKGVAEYAKGGVPVQMRTRAEVEAFFTGLHMIDPGLTLTHRWHNTLPESELPADQDISIYAAVARIP
ncbi:SAM-dependent methyltransferase [Streptomyces sparsus]